MKKLLRGLCLAISIALIGFALVGCGGGGGSSSNPPSGDGYKVEGRITVDESLLANSRASVQPVKSIVCIAELCNVGHYTYQTTENGYYVFNNVPAGHYNIHATTDNNADLCINAPITVDGNTNVPETQTALQKGNKYTVNLVDKNNQKLNAEAEVFLLGIPYKAEKSLAAFETKAISKNVKSADAIVKINGIEYKETLAIDNSKTVLTLTVTGYENSSEPPTPPTEDDFAGGTGTTSDPYQISNSKHLCNVNKAVEKDPKACFKLTGNVDMNGVAFTPICGFEGTFYGNNLTISNLTVECDYQAALFQQTFNATLENINLTNVKATAKAGSAAGLVGTFSGKGTITNCKVSSAVITDNGTVGVSANSGKYTGGIVGLAEDGSSTITRCSFQGTITGNTFVAGIVGNGANTYNGHTTTVSTCIVNGTINGKASVHQYANNCKISNCSGEPKVKTND